ncbi:uncharacterized protein LOC143352211 [Halictus rubicundus]|uniref:uncharacterized protein LOC143352211 n=1 Tax=Halictus rubicundus TaxID=77578 RepID=UPI0040361ECC
MDQYISTYQKDYTWPSRKIQRAASKFQDAGFCSCDSSQSREIKVTELCGDQQSWSRMGPMGRLLDPKLYPAKTGPHPETEVTKFDQPDTYIKKLEEKHPNLYGVLKDANEDEIRLRVDQDRLKTTYQLDYGAKESEICSCKTVVLIDRCFLLGNPDRMNGGPRSAVDTKVDDASARTKLIQKRIGKRDEKKKFSKSKRSEDEVQETRLPPWRSEYQDSISKLGSSIMTLKMHQKKSAAPAWAMGV